MAGRPGAIPLQRRTFLAGSSLDQRFVQKGRERGKAYPESRHIMKDMFKTTFSHLSHLAFPCREHAKARTIGDSWNLLELSKTSRRYLCPIFPYACEKKKFAGFCVAANRICIACTNRGDCYAEKKATSSPTGSGKRLRPMPWASTPMQRKAPL